MPRQLALLTTLPPRAGASGRGGRRPGAGRKPAGPRAFHPHGTRPFLSRRHPVHVVLRVDPVVGRLRRRSAYQAFRRALLTTHVRGDFRVVHVSIQRHHVHLLCEADDRIALANGVRGLSISAAHRLNAAISRDHGARRRRRGRVFTDRYHATAITSPTQARHALAYVLNNWRKHTVVPRTRGAVVDPYSSAVAFPGWAGRNARPFPWPHGYEPLSIAYPTTWLLTTGWRRAGPPIAIAAQPRLPCSNPRRGFKHE